MILIGICAFYNDWINLFFLILFCQSIQDLKNGEDYYHCFKITGNDHFDPCLYL